MGEKPEVPETKSSSKASKGVVESAAPVVKVVTTRQQLSKKGILLTVAAAVVLLAAGGYFVWQNTTSKTTPAPATPQAKYKAVDDSLKTQFNDGDYQKTIQTINAYLATNPPQEYAKQVTIQQGAAYLNTRDYPNALVWYGKALAMSTTPYEKMAAIHGLAFTYERSGDKAAALEQYKAAYAIAKSLSATSDQALRLSEKDARKIQQLGGTP